LLKGETQVGLGYLTLVILLLLSPLHVNAQWWMDAPPPVVKGQVMPLHWWQTIKDGCSKNNTNPFGVAAVMAMECMSKKRSPWHEGQIGNTLYIGPCGFNRECEIPKEIIYTPKLQIMRACWLLRGDLKSRLKKYNKTWYLNNYLPDTLALKRQLERTAKAQLKLLSNPTAKMGFPNNSNLIAFERQKE
jgi:hypothetical protein